MSKDVDAGAREANGRGNNDTPFFGVEVSSGTEELHVEHACHDDQDSDQCH